MRYLPQYANSLEAEFWFYKDKTGGESTSFSQRWQNRRMKLPYMHGTASILCLQSLIPVPTSVYFEESFVPDSRSQDGSESLIHYPLRLLMKDAQCLEEPHPFILICLQKLFRVRDFGLGTLDTEPASTVSRIEDPLFRD